MSELSSLESSYFNGSVMHSRHKPGPHSFIYKIGMVFLPLEGSEEDVNNRIKLAGIKGKFKRKNYFGDQSEALHQSVLKHASKVHGSPVSGDVFLLGQLQNWGFYFSPVNFYLIKSAGSEKFKYLVPEVTNTPWNEKHCYLVDLEEIKNQKKEFHVSPFNPMDMTYQWGININNDSISVKIECHRKDLEFEAKVSVHKNAPGVKNSSFESFKIMFGIYVQALKLILKKTPFYSHPKQRSSNGKA